VIAGMMLILIFLGIFVDQVSMMMITLPIFMPVVQALAVDPIWFGVLFLICMQLGLLLPPHGLLLMTMKGSRRLRSRCCTSSAPSCRSSR
jgi:TRAP-type C4-dicarboxylate transport system permease large subunit